MPFYTRDWASSDLVSVVPEAILQGHQVMTVPDVHYILQFTGVYIYIFP